MRLVMLSNSYLLIVKSVGDLRRLYFELRRLQIKKMSAEAFRNPSNFSFDFHCSILRYYET